VPGTVLGPPTSCEALVLLPSCRLVATTMASAGLTESERRDLVLVCGGDLLQCAAARVLLGTPDPRRWTASGIEGALCFVYDPSCDAHVLRLFSLGADGQGAATPADYHLSMELELYDDPRFFELSEKGGCPLHAFETDDFMTGFQYASRAEADSMLEALALYAPRKEDDSGKQAVAEYDFRAAQSKESVWEQSRRMPRTLSAEKRASLVPMAQGPGERPAVASARTGAGSAVALSRSERLLKLVNVSSSSSEPEEKKPVEDDREQEDDKPTGREAGLSLGEGVSSDDARERKSTRERLEEESFEVDDRGNLVVSDGGGLPPQIAEFLHKAGMSEESLGGEQAVRVLMKMLQREGLLIETTQPATEAVADVTDTPSSAVEAVEESAASADEPAPGKDTAVEDATTTMMAVVEEQGSDAVVQETPAIDLSVGPEEAQDLSVGPEEAQDLSVGPEEAQDHSVGPEEAQDLSVGPEEAQDLSVGPEEAQDQGQLGTIPEEASSESSRRSSTRRRNKLTGALTSSLSGSGERFESRRSTGSWDSENTADRPIAPLLQGRPMHMGPTLGARPRPQPRPGGARPRPVPVTPPPTSGTEAPSSGGGLLAEIRSKGLVGLRKVSRERRGTTTRLPGNSKRRVSIANVSPDQASSILGKLQSTMAARFQKATRATVAEGDEDDESTGWTSEEDFE
jgi:hypothetical protein